MKNRNLRSLAITLSLLIISFFIVSCSDVLDHKVYNDLSKASNTPSGLKALVTSDYALLAGVPWGVYSNSWRELSGTTTNILRGKPGAFWDRMFDLNYDPDFVDVTENYNRITPYISRITVHLSKIKKAVKRYPSQEEELKRYIGQLKGLRGYYSEMLYFYYGPFRIITDPDVASNPDRPYKPRPPADSVVAQIERDFLDAASVLPEKYTGSDYGRLSKSAALTGLMKLYLQEKKYDKAIDTGRKIKKMGYSLAPEYTDNFSIENKGGKNTEIIFAIVCSANSSGASNKWLTQPLAPDYKDTTGIDLTIYDVIRMPWSVYDKFSKNDKRADQILAKYPTGRDSDGNVIYKNARTAKSSWGALPKKFLADPSEASSVNSSVDFPVFRYADVLLMMAESINMANNGPNAEAYHNINLVRKRAGLSDIKSGLSKEEFLKKIQKERLFEFWVEGGRRIDLIRWGLFISRAKARGAKFAEPHKKLLPLPRSLISQSNGVIKQNPGY